MKAVMVIYEAAADLPQEELDGRTPMQVARSPAASALTARGCTGVIKPVKESTDGRNEVMLAEMLGVSSDEARGLCRGPVEAESLVEEDLAKYRYAYRGNFVTLDEKVLSDGRVASLSFEETKSLARALNAAWPGGGVKFAATGAARVVALCKVGDARMSGGYPPCLVEGAKIDAFLPGGRSGTFMREVLDKSNEILLRQTLNDVRLDLGENPANALWLWGGGPLGRKISSEIGRKACKGCVLTQSAMAAGLGRMCGIEVMALTDPWACAAENASAFDETELAKKLEESDFLLVYVEAAKKMGQYGSAKEKVRALELIDRYVLEPLLNIVCRDTAHRIALCTDSLVPTGAGRPVSAHLPFVLAGEGFEGEGSTHWDEETSARGSLGRIKVGRIVRTLLKDN